MSKADHFVGRGPDVIFVTIRLHAGRIVFMNPLISASIKLLEILFVIGMLGSLAVLAVSLVEDVEVILDRD